MPYNSTITGFTFSSRTDKYDNDTLVLQVTKNVHVFGEPDSSGLDYLPEVRKTVTTDATTEDLMDLIKNNFYY